MKMIPVAGPWITQKEIDYVNDAVTNAWYADANMFNERFEKAFADYIGVQYAVSLPSCTAGLHLSLLAMGIGPGDEVIVPDITWIASSAPLSYIGASPVFADIDKRTWCLSLDSTEACITPRTKAIIAVDLYGNMPDMDSLRLLAEKYNLSIIEDAAEAIGSTYKGKPAGGFGDTGVFSFHGSKTLTTGEGGMLVTNQKSLLDRVLALRDHGRYPGDLTFWNSEIGYKYKMSSMQAALGLAQLERIEELITRKRQIFAWYADAFQGNENIILNDPMQDVRSSYWMVTAIIAPHYNIYKSQLMELLHQKKIDSRPFFYPLSALPPYSQTSEGQRASQRNHVAYSLSPFGINLPSGYNMTKECVDFVCDELTCLLKNLQY